MNKKTYQQIKEIFFAALDLPPGKRAKFLDKRCKNEETLRFEVEKLLDSHGKSGYLDESLLDQAAAMVAAAEAADADLIVKAEQLNVGTIIGHYRLQRMLGAGGMGSVYLGKHTDNTIKRSVAIKLIKRGMDTDAVVRRFLYEMRILAIFDHPGIARLYDGGATPDGRPYFVMEYIKGEPVLQYADNKKLSITKRLELFTQICESVQFAHQRLVIHRDLKPSNILITNEGRSKLLDFGIAKILDPEIAGHALVTTLPAARFMTYEYASPEQIEGKAVTTASDVYSLGVLLFELLTGHSPYRKGSRSIKDFERLICKDPVLRPSDMVQTTETYKSGNGEHEVVINPELVSRNRSTSKEKLQRDLKGDLDNIVLKAMSKDLADRYATVDQFREDIDRHFKGLPVKARKETRRYKISKFIERHKVGVSTTAAIITSAAIIGRQVTQAKYQQDRAEQRSQDIRDLVTSFVRFQDSIKDLAGSTAAREQIAKSSLEQLNKFASEGEENPEVLREIAVAYQKIGDAQGNPYENNYGDRKGALDSYGKAQLLREKLTSMNPSNITDQQGLGIIRLRICQVTFGMGQRSRAIEECRQGIAIAEKLHSDKQLDLGTARELPNGYRTLGYAYSRSGDPQSALECSQKGKTIFEDLINANPGDLQLQFDLITLDSCVADALVELRRYPDALNIFNKILQADKARVMLNPANLGYQMAVATDYMKIGDTQLLMKDPNAAAGNFRQMMQITETAATDTLNIRAQNLTAISHVRLGKALSMLGELYESQKHLELAAKFFRDFANKNPSSPYALIQMVYTDMQISVVLARMRKGREAIDLGESARKIADQESEKDPASIEFRGIKAGMYMMFGEAYAALSEPEKNTQERIRYLTEAKRWYQNSYDILVGLQKEGQSTDREYGTPEELMEKILKCNKALTSD